MSENQYPAIIPRAQSLSMIVGGLGLVAIIVGFLVDRDHASRSYLMAFFYWIGIALGSLGLLMIQHLTSGGWGFIIRRQLEAAAKTIPIMIVLFVPILIFGMHSLYEWSDPAHIAGDHMLQWKQKYLNVPFFIGRLVAYGIIWGGIALLLNKWSTNQDKATTRDQALDEAEKCQRVSAPGLLILGLTITFASVDWVMSLDPHWMSTIFGILTIGGFLLSSMSFAILILTRFAKEKPLSDRLNVVHLHDLGKLMKAFVLLWAYFSLSQYLIIWSGNLPEETPWYLNRQEGIWNYVAIGLIVFYFVVPFLLLLPRNTKRKAERASKVAFFLLIMRFVEIFWIIKPKYGPGHPVEPFSIAWTDIVFPIGLGGIWLFLFFKFLQSKPLLPQKDPYIKETPAHGH